MEPSWRKPVGVLGLLVYLALYTGGVATLAPWIGQWPSLLQTLAYLLLGLAWLPPVKPLLRWMGTGQWRRP